MILAQQVERIEIQTHGQPARLNRFSVNDIFVMVSTAMGAQVLIKRIQWQTVLNLVFFTTARSC